MATTLDRREMLRLRDEYVRDLEQDTDPEKRRIRLAAMAHAMQMTLSLPDTQASIPQARAFDCLMRAVAHGIQAEGDHGTYVREKATVGYNMLMGR